MKRRAFLCVWLLLARNNPAQTVTWPYDEQDGPREQSVIADSNRTDFSSRQSLYINTFINRDSLSVVHAGGATTVRQALLYDLNYNTVAHSRNEYFDLSGAAMKKGFLLPDAAVGIDWTPILILNSNKVSQAVLGSADIGPVARMKVFRIPLTLRGGYAVKRWSDSLPAGNKLLRITEALRSDNGYYGAFDFGDGAVPLPFIPLRAALKGYGRNMETAKMIAGTAALSMTKKIPTGDSVFMTYNDSLVDGRDAMLSEANEGKSRYINESRRIERSYQISGGFKGKYRFFLQPAVAYSFARYSVEFPANSILTADRRNTDNGVTMLLRTDSLSFINYRGALRIDWENEEKLGGKSIKMKVNPDNSNLDSLQVALNDYDGYRAVMEHTLSVYSPKGIGLQYSFAISRYSQTYPRYYLDGSQPVRNYDDNDWIVQKHHLETTLFSYTKGKILASGEYSSNLRYYLKEQRSADNATDQLYRAGVTFLFSPLEKIRLDEVVQAEAKRTTYAFPVRQAENQNYAPYSRRFLSNFGLHMKVFNHDTVHVQWNEIYTDQGYWYIDTMAQAASYYAILNKTWDHSVTFRGNHCMENGVMLSTGSSVQGIYALDYRGHDYRPDPFMIKYVVIPFISIGSALNERMSIKGKLRRYIDTITDDYWDFTILFNVGF